MAKKKSKEAETPAPAPAKKQTKKADTPAPAAKKKEAKAPPAMPAGRMKWFDEQTHQPLLETYARRLDSFLQTMADGIVEEHELKAQEERLVGLMQQLEPLLDDNLHARVTQLLCEVTAYDIMQMVHSLQEARPKTKFRG
jgi:hypothetical protein